MVKTIRRFAHFPPLFGQFPMTRKPLLRDCFTITGFFTKARASTGNRAFAASIRQTARSLKNVPVADVFAEGLALVGDTLIQLTWKEKAALEYSLSDFKMTGAYSYEGEGWGLTFDGRSLIMSNGSDTLFVRSKSFALQKKIPVTVNGRPLKNLNELEYAGGRIYANVWYDNSIVEIMPLTGKVVKIIDCISVVEKAQTQSSEEVLNGIAYNPQTGTFYITGKNWRYMFEVRW